MWNVNYFVINKIFLGEQQWLGFCGNQIQYKQYSQTLNIGGGVISGCELSGDTTLLCIEWGPWIFKIQSAAEPAKEAHGHF